MRVAKFSPRCVLRKGATPALIVRRWRGRRPTVFRALSFQSHSRPRVRRTTPPAAVDQRCETAPRFPPVRLSHFAGQHRHTRGGRHVVFLSRPWFLAGTASSCIGRPPRILRIGPNKVRSRIKNCDVARSRAQNLAATRHLHPLWADPRRSKRHPAARAERSARPGGQLVTPA